MNRLIIYDTTLRDGMQGTGISYTLEDKLAIARQLDAFGIDYIEGGFPLSNKKEAEFFRQIRSEPLAKARLAAFGSTRRPHQEAASDPHIRALLEAQTPTVTVVGKTWTEHVHHVLRTTPEENLRMISDSVQVLKGEGREVFFDLEHFFDGYKQDPGYALAVLHAASDAGADCLVLCDTNGGTLPAEVSRIIGELPRAQLACFGVHCHNDTENAVANSLAAVEAGATARAGDHQRLGRALRQRQFMRRDPQPGAQNGARAGLLAQPPAPDLPGPIRGRKGQHHPGQAPAVRG